MESPCRLSNEGFFPVNDPHQGSDAGYNGAEQSEYFKHGLLLRRFMLSSLLLPQNY
jgi:hypothetical protein